MANNLKGREVQYLNKTRESYYSAKNLVDKDPQVVAGAIRTSLENALKLFWLTQFRTEALWHINGRQQFNLYEAIKSPRLKNCFSPIDISDMDVIRIMCNEVLHGSRYLTAEEAEELLSRLEKCLQKVQVITGITILTPPAPKPESKSEPVPKPEPKPAVKPAPKPLPISVEQPAPKPVPVQKTPQTGATKGGAAYEREFFWDMLQKTIRANGSPFTLVSRSNYAGVNKTCATFSVGLCLDFSVAKKIFRIGIFILDDTKTNYYDRLLRNKSSIDARLGFPVMWRDHGEKQIKTKRIAVELPFVPNDHSDYQRVIDQAFPIILKFIEVFSVYLPEGVHR